MRCWFASILILLAACAAPTVIKPPIPTASPQEIADRITKMLRAKTSGAIGLYLKEVDGSVLASFHEDQDFEPASSIKILFLLYALRQVQSGNANLATAIRVYEHSATTSCPGLATAATESLGDALKWMMRNSDNERTKAISETFGINNINALAQSLGMTHTRVNHTIGCGEEARANHNHMTLADAARLYEGVANGTWLDATNRITFFAVMAGRQQYEETQNDPAGIWQPALLSMIDEELPADVSPLEKENFRKRMDLVYKDGRYIFCTDGLCNEYRSVAGLATIPFCIDSKIAARRFIFGLFIDGGIDPVLVDQAFDQSKAELFREQIRTALRNWMNCAGK